ncbi:MAG: PIN domain-containing protein [Tabrizicola flagellatus]|uniref:PIN domain-containing protein n=1 Tax=Tabrizicola flagellatus TaxID=2593021 RepID=UPI00391D3D14
MIAIDTNVLVRFLTQDDPEQGAIARRFLAGLTVDHPGFVAREVLVELVWVLERAYGCSRAEIASALEGVLAAAELEVEASDDVGTVLQAYRDQGFGFADLMIAAAGRQVGAESLVTFDRKAARLPGVELLEG